MRGRQHPDHIVGWICVTILPVRGEAALWKQHCLPFAEFRNICQWSGITGAEWCHEVINSAASLGAAGTLVAISHVQPRGTHEYPLCERLEIDVCCRHGLVPSAGMLAQIPAEPGKVRSWSALSLQQCQHACSEGEHRNNTVLRSRTVNSPKQFSWWSVPIFTS